MIHSQALRDRIETANSRDGKRQRTENESEFEFGRCGLTLKPITVGVATPSGHLYDKEALLTYMSSKKVELKKQWEDYEQQLHEQELETVAKVSREKRMQVESFIRLHDNMEPLMEDVSSIPKAAEMHNASGWIPNKVAEPKSKKSSIKAPSKRPPSPNSGKGLKLREIYDAEITRDKDGNVVCPVTRKQIRYQEMVLIKPSKQVVSLDALNEVNGSSMTCPVKGMPIDKKDVLRLKSSASSFASKKQP